MALVTITTVEKEAKTNPELKKSNLDTLRDWHKKQPHLPPMSDSELILFIDSNYYRSEPTKITIDTYFALRTHVPQFFSRRDPLQSKELREIIKIIGSNTLNKKIPIDLLPNDYDGKAGPLKDLWVAQVKQIEEHHEFFRLQETRKVNEAVRPSKAKNATEIFGFEGRFKKLDID